MSIGRNSWQKAFAKAKKKSNLQSSEGPAPNPQSSEGPGPSQDPKTLEAKSVLTRMADRSPDVVPTKSTFARMTGYFPPATPRYNDAAKSGLYKLEAIPPGDEGKGLRIMAQSTAGAKKVEEFGYDPDSALARHMKFCGGASKPYKKK